jgi:hypothetical protein
MIITSSTSSFLPEKSSSAFDLMSWIGRGNVLAITVDMALMPEGIVGNVVSVSVWWCQK